MGIAAVVLKIASRCNLNCSYCYMYNHEDQSWRHQPKVIADDILDRTLVAMRDECERRGPRHRTTLALHGGEPTLVGIRRFAEIAERARAVLGDRLAALTVQTNAVLLTPAWIETFRAHDVRVSVSLDGPREIHDAARVDHRGRGSYQRTVAGLELLIEGGLAPKVLSVVHPGRSGAAAYRHLRALGITRIDFLLPDVTHDSKPRLYPAADLGSTPVADFLIPAFDAWIDEDDPAVEVRVFADLLRSMLGDGPGSDAFGNPLMSYLVVDTDGSIEAMDALRVCREGMVRSGLNVLTHGFDDLEQGLPLVHRAVHEGFPLAETCRRCPEREVCGGGHLPHRWSGERGFDNPSAWCADVLALLAHVRARTGITEPLSQAV